MPQQPLTFATLPDEIRGYRLDGLLGAGAMGAVYRAIAPGGRRGLEASTRVALKILDPRFAPDADIVRRFKRRRDLLRDRQRLGERHRTRAIRCDKSSPSTSSITRARSPQDSSRP